jgi:mannose/fructose/N-acetylgalactosamine-specific phosphotransferase system component IIC
VTGTKLAFAGTAIASGISILAQHDFPTWVGQVGFPIAVAGFLLVEMRREVRRMTTAFNRLARAIERASTIEFPSSDGEPDEQ